MARLALQHPLVLALALSSMAGCAGRGVNNVPRPGAPRALHPAVAAPHATAALAPGNVLLPLPAVTSRRLIAVTNGSTVTGTVTLSALADSYFANNAANYALETINVGSALVNAASLEEDLYTFNSNVLVSASGADGTFSMANAPSDRAYVLEARLAGDHQLSAIVPKGGTVATIDEASSMVTELARWQLLPFADANQPDLSDVSTADVALLHNDTQQVLNAADLQEVAGAVPSVEALKTGAGHLLRNIYVAEFGAKVTAPNTTSTPPQANELSDTWERILGYKPLALTVAVGSGVHTSNLEEGKTAATVDLVNPTDTAEDAQGNLFIADFDNFTIQMVPRRDIQGPYLQATGDPGTGTLSAGHVYTIAGVVNGIGNSPDYNTAYTNAATADPTGAPAIAPPSGFQLFTPCRLALQSGKTATTRSNIYYSSTLDSRVFVIPCEDGTLLNVPVKAGHLYPVAGTGNNLGVAQGGGNAAAAEDAVAATSVDLGSPSAIALDAQGNLYILDTGSQGSSNIRVVSQHTGKIFTLPVDMNGNPLQLANAGDMRLSPDGNWLYVSMTDQHFVFRIPAPTPASLDAMVASPAPVEIQVVLGNPGKPGFLDTSLPGVRFPDIHQLALPVAASVNNQPQVLLNAPTALAFRATANPATPDLFVADTSRIRMLRGGQVYTVGGGVDSNFVEGDARLCYFQSSTSLEVSPADGNLLVTDNRLGRIRRLWTGRGVIHTGD